MVEPVTTGALVGVGWFANKLLGPSADALGDQLKIYAGDRLSKIFGRAEELAAGASLKPLPPGFAHIAIQRASFSEDEEKITDMWANLLLNSSGDYQNRHVLFAEILSQIGTSEAQWLEQFCPSVMHARAHMGTYRFVDSVREYIEVDIRAFCGGMPINEQNSSKVFNQIKSMSFDWPTKVTYTSMPFWTDMETTRTLNGGSGISIEIEILERQGLLRAFSYPFQTDPPTSIVSGYSLTELGLEFLAACREKG